MFEKSLDHGVLTLGLCHGKANTLDVGFLEALSSVLAEIEADDAIGAVVMTGQGGIFSAGVDLKQILDGGADYAIRFIPVLDRVLEELFAFPKPLVAAINGHAIAGGCILALACDLKLMARGKGRIGIPELKVGVPFPAAAFEIVRYALPADVRQSVMYEADTHLPEAAVELGLVDRLSDPDELLQAAVNAASQLAAIPAASFAVSKAGMRHPGRQLMAAYRQAHEEAIVARWSADETYAHIRGYLQATLK